MEAIVRWLQEIDPELTPQEMAELIWLWVEALTPEPLSDSIADFIVQESSESEFRSDEPSPVQFDPLPSVDKPSPVQETSSPLQAYLISGNSKAIPFKTPDAPAFRNPLELARSLRPFKRKYPSAREMVFDEEATVNRIVDQQLWIPVLKPAAERWFDLTLIVEDTASMSIWRKVTEEWLNLLKHHGAFRKVALWYLQYEDERWQIQSDRSTSTQGTKLGSYRELIESTGRHHFLVLSDCVSPQWTSGAIYPVLKDWSVYNPVTILQVMSEKYWSRTALGRGRTVQLSNLEPDTKNDQFRVKRSSSRRNPLPPNPGLKLPIVTFDRVSLQQWALVMMGSGKTSTVGTVFASQETLTQPRRVARESPETAQSAMDRIQRFRLMASPLARRLAGLMSAVPVTLSIARLIQQAMLKESSQIHLAEVFLSGLIDRESSATHFRNDPEECPYQFFEGVRELLLESISYSDVDDVLDRVSVYIAQKAGYAIKTFNAFLELYPQLNEEQRKILEPFAKLTPTVLRRLGGYYETIADELEAWEPLISPVQEDTLQLAQSETTGLPGIPPVASEDPVFPPLEPLEIVWGEWESDTVLWVDDRPNNNINERQTLEALGINFVLATSTDEALERLARQRFDAIISDMGRPPDPRAGYTLLDQLRSTGKETPFIIYAGSRDPEHVAESRSHGAIGCTNNANELIKMVMSVLGRDLTPPEPIVLEPTQPQQTQQTVIDLPPELPTPQGWQNLQVVEFNFTVVTLKPNGTEQKRRSGTARGFVETLEPLPSPPLGKGRESDSSSPRSQGGVRGGELEMVEIPGGTFLMGAPKTEQESSRFERPQHSVTLPSFYLGRYPVTQAQWRVVAVWDKIDRVLKPDPSGFKGADRPVEQVSWDDAVEFCNRLKQRFGKNYCLPSEAQLEYACRAKTETPFHFGETLNTGVVNYNGSYTYVQGRKGIYREKTTPVTTFGVANPWGLVDVHGNVWEWCQDDWHENYNGAPEDGSAWLKNISTTLKVRRGGSWINNPRDCRSAYRYWLTHDYRADDIGFRVCCLAPRGLP